MAPQRDDLIDPNIQSSWTDPNTKRRKMGNNVERMKDGLNPVNEKNQPIVIHHMLQEEPGPVAEVSRDLHQRTPHKQVEDGKSWRRESGKEEEYDRWKEEYWKLRAKDFEK